MIQNLPFVGIIIIGITALISFKGFKDDGFFNSYSFQIDKIRSGSYLRLLSSGFLHVGISHLLFNMITLYFFIGIVVYSLGTPSFLVLYFVSLIAGNLFGYGYHYNDQYYTAVGASGAVTGVLFSALLLYPQIELYLFFIPIPIPGYLFGIGYILYTLYGMKSQNDTIGHTAHFGGAIGGIFITLLLKPTVLEDTTLMLSVLSVATVAAGIMLYRQQLKKKN